MRRRTYLSCPRALLSEIASVIFAGEGLGAFVKAAVLAEIARRKAAWEVSDAA